MGLPLPWPKFSRFNGSTLARAHLEELERRGVAKEVDEGRLEIAYALNQDVLRKIRD